MENGGEWSRDGEDLRAETEFAVELRSELAAGAGRSAVSTSIAGLCVVLEIVDLAYPPGDLDAVMRGNVFHRAVAFGPTCPLQHDRLGAATLRLDDTIHQARERMPDPLWVVRTVADTLGEFGEILQAGDRILSGSFVHEPLGNATSASAAIENLGSVSLSIRERPSETDGRSATAGRGRK